MSDDIKKLQTTLFGLGLYKGQIDGIAGEKTTDAVKKFQRIHPPLTVDGIAGQKTLTELYLPPFGNRDDIDEVERDASSKYPRQKQADLEAYYGKIGDASKIVKCNLPYTMKLAWKPEVYINRFSCHEKIRIPLQEIFTNTLRHYGEEKIRELGLDMWGGCYNIRNMRGGKNPSTHSWAIAVDMDPAHNQLKWNHEKARLAKPEYDVFWDIVEATGAISLGRAKNYDWQHFQFART